MRPSACLLLVTIALIALRPAPADAERPRLISPSRRAAAIAAAVVPGAIAHGLGSWIAGEDEAARRLALSELAAVAVVVIGGVPLFLSHGSRRLAGPAVPLALSGTAMLTTGWLADVWTAAGGGGIAGQPRAAAPWQLEVATTYASDPLFDESLYTRIAGTYHLGRLGLASSAMIAADGDAQLAHLDVQWRLAGSPATGSVIADGSRLDLRATVRGHRHGNDGFTLATGEVGADGRLDLATLAPAIAGAFVELGLALGLETTFYEAGPVDTVDLALGRFAFGAYLGRGRGEVSLWYDHRRDDLAGGIAASRAAGFVGSVGTTADVAIAGPWALGAELQLGSAWLATVALRYCGGLP